MTWRDRGSTTIDDSGDDLWDDDVWDDHTSDVIDDMDDDIVDVPSDQAPSVETVSDRSDRRARLLEKFKGHLGDVLSSRLAKEGDEVLKPTKSASPLVSPEPPSVVVTDDFLPKFDDPDWLKQATDGLQNRTPGTFGRSMFMGEVKLEPVTTLDTDEAFKDVAERVWASQRDLDYKRFRAKLNTEIRKIIRGAAKSPLKEILEIRGEALYWKTGAFKGDPLQYAHTVSQQTIKNLGLDNGLYIHLSNLAPVGGPFHKKEYGHLEEIVTDYGKKMTEEAKAGLRRLRVDWPPGVPRSSIAEIAPSILPDKLPGPDKLRPRSGQAGFVDPALLLGTRESRQLLDKFVRGLAAHGVDTALLAVQGQDEGAAFATMFEILVGTLAMRAVATPQGALAVTGAVAAGTTYQVLVDLQVAISMSISQQIRALNRLDGAGWWPKLE